MVASLIPVVGHSTPPPPAAALSSATVYPGLRLEAHYEAAAFLRSVRLGGLTAAEVEAVIVIEPEQRARLLEFAAESGKRAARMIQRTFELRELTLKEFQRLARAKTLPVPAGPRGERGSSSRTIEWKLSEGKEPLPLWRRPRPNAGSDSQPKATHPKRARPGAGSRRPADPRLPDSCRVTDVSRRRELPAVEFTCPGPSDCFQSWTKQVGLLALSRALAVHRSTIHSWVNGKRTPKPEHARIIISLSVVVPLSHGASQHALTYEDLYGRVEARAGALQGELSE